MDITIQFLTLIPVVIGLVQVFKILGLSSRLLPLLSLVLGVLGTAILGGLTGFTVIQGLVVGLSAVGLWSGTTNTLENVSKK